MKYDRKMSKPDTIRKGMPPGHASSSGQALPKKKKTAVHKKKADRTARQTGVPSFVENRSPQREDYRREQIIRDNVTKRKKRHKKNYILYYILLFVILLIVGITLSLTVFFNIQKIGVAGNGSVPEAEIIKASGIKAGDNLFRISTERAEKSIINQYINVDKATVSRALPSTLSIRLELAKVMCVVVDEGKYYSLSYGGRIIKAADKNTESGAILIYGCKIGEVPLGSYLESSPENNLDALQIVANAIHDNGLDGHIQSIDLSDITTIKLYYDERIEIKFGGITDFDYELAHVKQMIENNIGKDEIVSIDATLRNGKYYIRPLEALTLPSETEAPESSSQNQSSSGTDSGSGTLESSSELTSSMMTSGN